MTRFIHKNGQIEISYSEYSKLSALEKQDFQVVNSTNTTTNIITNNNQKTDDLLGIGKVAETAACVAILPVAIVASLFDW